MRPPREWRTNHKLPPIGKLVTVCLGFNCAGGIVMCADSKETYPDAVKVDVSKISSTQNAHGSFVFTGATSDSDVMDSAIDRLKEKFSSQEYELHRPRGWQAKFPLAETAIREVMNEIREESILPFPVDQQPWLNLLIGISKRGVDVLFKATPRAVVRVADHTCVGAGVIQATALLDRLWEPRLSRPEMEVFAIYVMRLIKKYVPDVDGYTDVVSLTTPHGYVKWWAPSRVFELEQRFSDFDEYEKTVLSFICCDPEDPHAKFKGANIKTAQESLLRFREEISDIAKKEEESFKQLIAQTSADRQ